VYLLSKLVIRTHNGYYSCSSKAYTVLSDVYGQHKEEYPFPECYTPHAII